LSFGPFPNRGTSANQLVLALNFRGAATSDILTRVFLVGELNNFSVKIIVIINMVLILVILNFKLGLGSAEQIS
jgi:hypothetical protein